MASDPDSPMNPLLSSKLWEHPPTIMPTTHQRSGEKPILSFTFSFVQLLRLLALPLAGLNLWFLTITWEPFVATIFWIQDFLLVIWTCYRLVQCLGGDGKKFEARVGSFRLAFDRVGNTTEVFSSWNRYSHLNNRIDLTFAGCNFLAALIALMSSVWPYDAATAVEVLCFIICFLHVAIVVLSRLEIFRRVTVCIYKSEQQEIE